MKTCPDSPPYSFHDGPAGQKTRKDDDELLLPLDDDDEVETHLEAQRGLIDDDVPDFLGRDEAVLGAPERREDEAVSLGNGLDAEAPQDQERLGPVDAQLRGVQQHQAQRDEEIGRAGGRQGRKDAARRRGQAQLQETHRELREAFWREQRRRLGPVVPVVASRTAEAAMMTRPTVTAAKRTRRPRVSGGRVVTVNSAVVEEDDRRSRCTGMIEMK
ncbi:hypothetical protein PpBr36_07163 [Pyricularia pennisetigena]|uniref:hypothetical protein n=1 Tax=Pyricularia pennisetigena TaxID=1578925 RepID=UPI0011538658|nr:hypothetical protein PpBr36_07163 [Pyricularia pennisetigena]TLS25978.1 hypothetical protein PpBr36_07163 [Pyricularia pennisetigena]